ncbi:MAG: hypothetical protein AB7U24_02675 [Sulfurimonadaceae bacterium]
MIQEIISDMVEIQARAINKSFAIDQSFGLICLENTIELFEVFMQKHANEANYYQQYQEFLINLLRRIDAEHKNNVINNIPLPFMYRMENLGNTAQGKRFGL